MTTEEQKRKHREYMRVYNKTEKGMAYNRAHVKAWRTENPDKRKEQQKRESTMDKPYNLRKHLKWTYGITLEAYNEIFEKQKGCCAICGRHQSEFKRRLHLDHDHATREIRSLLCINCNHMLGNALENAEILQKGIEYLQQFKPKTTGIDNGLGSKTRYNEANL